MLSPSGSFDNTVDVWLVNHNDRRVVDCYPEYRKWLNESEIDRNSFYRFEENRRQHMAGKALTRFGLSTFNPEQSVSQWEFVEGEFGKPYIQPHNASKRSHFNISHTDNLVVAAFSSIGEVGVDVEWIRRKGEYSDLAQRCFAPTERKDYFSVDPALQKDRFFFYWTLKEAYIKACGLGLQIPLESFSFSLQKSREITFESDSPSSDEDEQWVFWTLKYEDDFRISVAQKRSDINMVPRLRFAHVVPGVCIEPFDPSPDRLMTSLILP